MDLQDYKELASFNAQALEESVEEHKALQSRFTDVLNTVEPLQIEKVRRSH